MRPKRSKCFERRNNVAFAESDAFMSRSAIDSKYNTRPEIRIALHSIHATYKIHFVRSPFGKNKERLFCFRGLGIHVFADRAVIQVHFFITPIT
jgi:hypothetical protein